MPTFPFSIFCEKALNWLQNATHHHITGRVFQGIVVQTEINQILQLAKVVWQRGNVIVIQVKNLKLGNLTQLIRDTSELIVVNGESHKASILGQGEWTFVNFIV